MNTLWVRFNAKYPIVEPGGCELGWRYGVSQQHIGLILRGKSRCHAFKPSALA